MRSRLHFAAFLAANAVALAGLGFFALPRLATREAPASLLREPSVQFVQPCPWASQVERARVLRQI